MDFWDYILGAFILGVLFLLDDYLQKTQKLKEEMKENYDLVDENYNLKKNINNLKEEKEFLKEVVMDFKDGELTKGELIKYVQSLVDKDNKEEKERLERLHNEIREIYDIDLREEDEEDYKK